MICDMFICILTIYPDFFQLLYTSDVIAVGSKALKSLCCIVMHNLSTLNKALLTYLLAVASRCVALR